ncbi:acetyltransferase [Anaerophaga thermohalophila]|uniref:acetyltransferase n=1 Tax=Anaerophaga thermohalophila TaxID=177400 RepID=UPI0002F3C72A|nr:acetyltransferase [Anaerophaga thermohalophila]
MKPQIILIGGGGHCKSCIDVIEQEGKYKIAGIVDMAEKVGQSILGYPIIGTDDDLPELVQEYKNVIITIGQIKSAYLRIKLYDQAKQLNAQLPVIVAPTAYVSRHASIQEGTIVMHHALINAEARIGINCIINSKALIEHEAIIGDFCHISTATCVNGQVNIGTNCFIGSNTVLSNNITISDNSIVAAGSQVLKSLAKPGIYIGNPLRKIR